MYKHNSHTTGIHSSTDSKTIEASESQSQRTQTRVTVFILAKNEEANIAKCLHSLDNTDFNIIILDSGSTDATLSVSREFSRVKIKPFCYIDHATTYNIITTHMTSEHEWAMILDADMEVSLDLSNDIERIIETNNCDIILAPVLMYIDGFPLKRGSLYPNKPIVFRGGSEYFVAEGHGERLLERFESEITHNYLIHNDLKPYTYFLDAQIRYGHNLHNRISVNQSRLRDKLRSSTPFMGFVSALYSLIVKRGILSGTAGILYALDRVIAGLIQFRVCVSHRFVNKQRSTSNENE